MANKMLIDATHPEETRVVVLRGNRVEEFDFESATRRQLKGNIYLAKVTRVEPSLQAAFVDYGGNRHGFLAFSEIHPDYYQIPIADRQALIAEEERAQRAAEAEAEHRVTARHRAAERSRDDIKSERPDTEADFEGVVTGHATAAPHGAESPAETVGAEPTALELPAESIANTSAAIPCEIPINLSELNETSAAEPIPGAREQVGTEADFEQPSERLQA